MKLDKPTAFSFPFVLLAGFQSMAMVHIASAAIIAREDHGPEPPALVGSGECGDEIVNVDQKDWRKYVGCYPFSSIYLTA